MSGWKKAFVGLAIVGAVVWAIAANWGALVGLRAPAAAAKIHYAPAENLERLDVELIDSAGETIDMTAYVLTDWAVIDALADAAARGVKVRIWRESTTAGYGDAAEIAKLTAAGAELRVKPPGDLMHLKSYCVDGLTLRTGAANFSASGEKRQDNDLVVIRSAAACAGFEANFAKLWGATTP
ncbi:MAG: phospholipase D-like domain-containing protein [Roseiarcus sp.]|jgi:phosphatidylserine/phosphatidylglycerophosphate/cardiolipin synthase-like enzyme